MSNENQIGTLEEMTQESFVKRPSQSQGAIDEYLLNLKDESEEKAAQLKQKLDGNAKYLEQFKVAITHTSLMVFLISIKAANMVSQLEESQQTEAQEVISQIQIDFDKYVREFLFFARQDDTSIYTMRLFYMDGLTGKALYTNEETGKVMINDDLYETKAERDAAVRKAELQMAKYDELLNSLKKQYIDSKPHLQ